MLLIVRPKRALSTLSTIAMVLLAGAGLMGCGDGYKKVNGKWHYETTDEYKGTTLKHIGADDNSMIVLKDGWAKDKNHVYYRGKAVKDADVKSFEPVSENLFARDKNHVFIIGPEPTSQMCEIIAGADPISFKVIKLPYFKDKSKVFCGNVPMDVANPDSFEAVHTTDMWNTCFDKGSFLFQYGDAFKDMEISRDRPAVTGNGAYGRDGKNYYFGPAKIDGADYASFQVKDSFNSSDKSTKYMFSFPADQAVARRKRYMGIG